MKTIAPHWLLLLLAVLACNAKNPAIRASPKPSEGGSQAPLPPGAPVVGEICKDEGESNCALVPIEGPSTVLCEEGLWELRDPCNTTCASQGECMVGCARWITDSTASCLCAPMGPNCPASIHCKSHHALEIPDGNGDEATVECIDACDNGPGSFSLGCIFEPNSAGARCLCGALGDSCEDSYGGRACVGDPVKTTGDAGSATLEIATCDQGIWSATSCADICGEPNAQCWRSNNKNDPDVCSCEV